MNLFRSVVVSILFPLLGTAVASEPIRSGEYGWSDDAGHLFISSASDAGMKFQLDSQGANLHACYLSGLIIEGRAQVTDKTGTLPVCVVDFVADANSIVVTVAGGSDNFENCRSFCGMRAGFEGSYSRIPGACTLLRRKNAHAQFTRAYEARDYRKAYELLKASQSRCLQFQGMNERDSTHNDMAITLYHLARNTECLHELSVTVAASARSEDTLRDQFVGEPGTFEYYLPIARATWNNQRLCSRPRTQTPKSPI